MHDKQFKQKVIKRYENSQTAVQLKNNIIYIMFIKNKIIKQMTNRLRQMHNRLYSLTQEQRIYLTQEFQFLDLAPYFEHLSKMEKIEDAIYKSNQITTFDLTDYVSFQYYEEHALGLIKTHIS